VFEHACRLGAEGHRLKADRQHLLILAVPRAWLKVRNRARIAERSEKWIGKSRTRVYGFQPQCLDRNTTAIIPI
jgi:hypothetical protein